ncbi:MAG: mucoidy inhibitor MuiA family protein, partial [Phycisphaerales bacterium]|nr:mucoidy inhibitor MuiA family protein [Phycisphaerales bacterium]
MSMRFAAFAVVLGALPASVAAGQDVPTAAVVDVPARPEAVTVYLGRAAVTRTAQVSLPTGLHALRFTALPKSVTPQTLQARVRGPARVLGVDELVATEASTSSPRVRELDRIIAGLEVALADVEGEHAIITAEERLVDAVGVRVSADATATGGTDRLDLDRVREQLAFVRTERERLLAARRTLDERGRTLQADLDNRRAEREAIAGSGGEHRVAVVTVAVSSAAAIEVDLSYLVTDATWEPAYNFRADPGGGGVVLEYDAMITQRTGEDWANVALTLSTAQPTQVTHPPDLEPWFVDLIERQPPGRATATAVPRLAAGVEELSQDAAVT